MKVWRWKYVGSCLRWLGVAERFCRPKSVDVNEVCGGREGCAEKGKEETWWRSGSGASGANLTAQWSRISSKMKNDYWDANESRVAAEMLSARGIMYRCVEKFGKARLIIRKRRRCKTEMETVNYTEIHMQWLTFIFAHLIQYVGDLLWFVQWREERKRRYDNFRGDRSDLPMLGMSQAERTYSICKVTASCPRISRNQPVNKKHIDCDCQQSPFCSTVCVILIILFPFSNKLIQFIISFLKTFSGMIGKHVF